MLFFNSGVCTVWHQLSFEGAKVPSNSIAPLGCAVESRDWVPTQLLAVCTPVLYVYSSIVCVLRIVCILRTVWNSTAVAKNAAENKRSPLD
jgi:hypothetical protein